MRPAPLVRDIAILVPTRTILAPLERALAEAGVPYRVEGGSLVYATQEVRDLINCLTAIDDPTDEVAVVGALRSPAYACSDVELARHRLGGGTLRLPLADARRPPTAASPRRCVDLRDVPRRSARGMTHRRAGRDAIIAGRRVVEVGTATTSGNRDAFRRARFVVEQARVFEAERPESLRAFVDWLEPAPAKHSTTRAPAWTTTRTPCGS